MDSHIVINSKYAIDDTAATFTKIKDILNCNDEVAEQFIKEHACIIGTKAEVLEYLNKELEEIEIRLAHKRKDSKKYNQLLLDRDELLNRIKLFKDNIY